MSKFCRHCGKKLKRGAIKCPRCGENVLDYDQKEASGSEKKRERNNLQGEVEKVTTTPRSNSSKNIWGGLVLMVGITLGIGASLLLRIDPFKRNGVVITEEESSRSDKEGRSEGRKETALSLIPTPTEISMSVKTPDPTATEMPKSAPTPTSDLPDDSGQSEAVGAYRLLDEYVGTESFAIGYRKGDAELAETVNGALLALVADGTYNRIGENYPDIKEYLNLKADGIDTSRLPARGSGDRSFVFKQGFDQDYPPYSYQNEDGTIGGLDVELCKAVCDYLGWGYEPVPFVWDAKEKKLTDGECDCIWSGFTMEGRENEYVWGIPYSIISECILVRADSDINNFEDLQGKIVGVEIASSAYDALMNSVKGLTDTFAELKQYESVSAALGDLESGATDAIVVDNVVGSYLVENS